MRDVVIVSGARTAIGNFGGGLKNVPLVDLGAIVLREALKRAGLRPVPDDRMMSDMPQEAKKDPGLSEIEKKYWDWDNKLAPVVIDEVIMGNVLPAGQGQNPARQSLIRAGLPKETPAMMVNKLCGSGLKAIALGANAIMTGEADVVLAGGMESMSNVPMALPKARWGYRMELEGIGEIYDLMVFDGIHEIFYNCHMAMTVEAIAEYYGITRKEQDELSVLSHARACKAIRDGMFVEEIAPVIIKDRKGDIVFDTDERPMETTMEKLAKLKPVFKKDGTITAGNASGLNDAAAAVLMMSPEKAKEFGLEPIVKVKAFASAALDPLYMGLGPVVAIRKVMRMTGMTLKDFDMIELNEAFAAQALGCMRELGIEVGRANELGSGISLGHPIGCTGARQMVTGMHQMKRKGYHTGLISMCIGGGMGMAMAIER